ncbi:MAG: hypothetical protein HXY25_11385 [Alphaproteobacteria bacterium]|nr:hypothetical protein [Alphaproteobacteria bacterium]
MARARAALLLLTLASVTLAGGPALGEPPPGKGPKDRGGEAGLSAEIRVTIGERDRERIRDYFRRNPGLAGKPLPPGIRNRLAQGKPLPPGIAKQVLPDDLRRLLEVGEGYELYQLGHDVVLIATATGIILDILRDIL